MWDLNPRPFALRGQTETPEPIDRMDCLRLELRSLDCKSKMLPLSPTAHFKNRNIHGKQSQFEKDFTITRAT